MIVASSTEILLLCLVIMAQVRWDEVSTDRHQSLFFLLSVASGNVTSAANPNHLDYTRFLAL